MPTEGGPGMECMPAIILILFTNYNNFCGILQLSPTGKNLAPKLNCHLCEGEDPLSILPT